MSAKSHSAPLHAGLPNLNRELMRLRQHITWLHGTLQRLADPQAMASTIDPREEMRARINYAFKAAAASLRQCAECGLTDRPPSLAALIVGQAFAAPPQEHDEPAPHAGCPMKPAWAVAWCTYDGQIHVGQYAPPDKVWLAEGNAHVLWHWIEELAVRGEGVLAGSWWVPHFDLGANIQQRADAAMAFGAALAEAGRTILPCTAPPAGRAVA